MHDMMPDGEKRKGRCAVKARIRAAALAAVWALWLTLVLEGYARGSAGAVLRWAVEAPGMFGMAWGLALGAGLIGLIFASLRARCVYALLLTWGSAMIGLVCRYKMRYRLEPALLSDVHLLSDAWKTVSMLDFQIDVNQILRISAAFALAALACLLVLRRRHERRPAMAACGLALLLILPGLCTFERSGDITRYDLANHALNEGMVYTALAVENQRKSLMRVDYTEEAVQQTYRKLAARITPAQSDDKPNIILILSESFSSGTQFSPWLSLTRDLTPFFDSLSQSCQSGMMFVPKAGGGTSETEFEVLSGMKSQYAANPYSLGLPDLYALPGVLRSKGYHASAIHWYAGVYYNRYHNLRSMGFDTFCTTDTIRVEKETCGMFVSDQEHYASVMEQLRDTPERDFVFVLTMQNHGGYAYDDFTAAYGADVPFTNAFSPETTKVLSNYCWLITQSDRALQAFIGELEAFEEPTIVAFFSDHIAPLGEQVYAEMGKSTAGDAGHLAPYFIWSNGDNVPSTVNLQAWQLGAQVLSAAGLLDDPFFTHVESLRQRGESVSAAHDLLSYDALFGRQYAYDEAGVTPGNEAFAIGGEMVLEGFDAALIADAVYLCPRLGNPDQAWKLSINGQLTDVPCVPADHGDLTLLCVMPNGAREPLNHSNVLTFESAQELLAQSSRARVRTRTIALWDWQSMGSGIVRSPFPAATGAAAALTVDGKRWDWQPLYALKESGQFSTDEAGYVYLLEQDLTRRLVHGEALLHVIGE